jgi:hypothetical protein
MLLELVPEQKGKFDRFAEFLQGDFPNFVLSNRSVCSAMEKYGTFLAVEPDVPAAQRKEVAGTTPAPDVRRRILLRSLVWGLPPTVMVMDLFGVGESSNPAGLYDPAAKRIIIHKDLVLFWQDEPEHKNLSRLIRAVLVHELVHYYNDVVLPGTTIYSGHGQHFNTHFSREAYGPLGWSTSDYVVFADVMKVWKSQERASA